MLLDVLGRLWTGNWWRRRESNPRPQALCHQLYMRSHVYCFNRQQPDEQGTLTAIPLKDLSDLVPDVPRRDLVKMTPECPCGRWTHKHGSSQTA